MPPATPVAGRSLADLYPELAKEALFDASKVRPGRGEKLKWMCGKCECVWLASPNYRTTGRGRCPSCHIPKLRPGNDIASKYPELVKFALFDASKVAYSSPKPQKWICYTCKSSYELEPRSKIRAGVAGGCPICSGRRLVVGVNDLATRYPEIAKEACFDPTTVFSGSNKRLLWQCSKCPYRWYSPPARRTGCRSGGCAVCAGKAVLKGVNDLATTKPELAKECLSDPTTVTAGSSSRLKWRCSKCAHEWEAIVANRSKGRGCPCCRIQGGFRPDGMAWVYLLAKEGKQKVGITRDIKTRLGRHGGRGWSCVDIKLVDGATAKAIERQCLYILDQIGVPRGSTAFRNKFEGYFESWQTVDWWADSLDCFRRELYTTVWNKVFSTC